MFFFGFLQTIERMNERSISKEDKKYDKKKNKKQQIHLTVYFSITDFS